MMKNKKIILSWKINTECNFSCKYCFSVKKNETNFSIDADLVLSVLEKTGKDFSIHFTGGEPFLYPGFVDLCEKLSKKYSLSIITNLSMSGEIRRLIRKVSSKKIFITITVHIEELERLEKLPEFIESINLLQKKGYSYAVVYIMYPPLIERFERDYAFFKKKGITLLPRLFRGFHSGKKYPESYRFNELKLIEKYNPFYFKNYPLFSKGLSCSAGRAFARVWPDGSVTRCVYDKISLGNISEKIDLLKTDTVCSHDICGCFGRDFVSCDLFSDFNVFIRDFIHYGKKLKYTRFYDIEE